MAQQQTFRLRARSSINDLVVEKEPVPSAGPHEVLVKVRSVALNYRDYAVATGKYPFKVKESVVPCSDIAGDVVEVGRGVEDVAAGDQVISSFDLKTLYGPIKDWDHGLGGSLDGGLREYVVLPANAIVKIPAGSGFTYAQLAALVCTGTTAWNSLYGNVPLKPGQTVLFLGKQAAGCVQFKLTANDC
jgi:NADPH:quinone reductase-like Zn-dependent oxidoreductase